MSKKKVDQTVDDQLNETLKKDEPLEAISEVDQLNEKIINLENELTFTKNEMLRDRAELENFKKRQIDERIKERKYKDQDLLSKLLAVIDSFDGSLSGCNYESVDDVINGIKQINKQFVEILGNFELKEIECLHKDFDPSFHQAIQTENLEEVEDNKVTMVFQKGYMYKDRVLRPSMVKVNQK